MKKPNNAKKSPAKKLDKKDSGELRKPAKLKPLKEKEKKSWKNNLDDEDEDDFAMDDDVKFGSSFGEDEEEEDMGFYDDDQY
jgi:hypothetical protein